MSKLKAWGRKLAPFFRVGRTVWKYRRAEVGAVSGLAALITEIVRSVH